MRFTLMINLDNAEAADYGPEALGRYLSDVAAHVRAGYGSGNVRDGSGVTVGRYAVEDEPGGRAGHFTPDEVDALIATAGDLYNEYGDANDVLSRRQHDLAGRAYRLLNGE